LCKKGELYFDNWEVTGSDELMNVNDAHFFPALAKSVSAHQGLKYKGLTG